MIKKSKFFPSLIIILAVFLITCVTYSADDFPASNVKDISDRNYEEAVIGLLDGAKVSIVMSMYNISLGTKANNPVKLLLNDLLEARGRGVSVTLYLNTRFRDVGKGGAFFVENPVFKKLEDAGCVIHLMPSNRTLHDKLIVVDSRYVVEGSANWSISALRANFESSTLIDSPDLARAKLARFENLLIISRPDDKKTYTPAYIENLPKSLIIPKGLLSNKEYFSNMVTRYDNRPLDRYLLLLAHSQAINKREFFVSLETMALSLGMPRSWDDTALRRQVIKSLKKLQNRYHLINVKFFHGRDAAVRLIDIPGEAFTISSDQIIQPQDKKRTMRLKFLFLIKALLKDEGVDIGSISQPAIAKRFNVNRVTIHAAFQDLQNYKK